MLKHLKFLFSKQQQERLSLNQIYQNTLKRSEIKKIMNQIDTDWAADLKADHCNFDRVFEKLSVYFSENYSVNLPDGSGLLLMPELSLCNRQLNCFKLVMYEAVQKNLQGAYHELFNFIIVADKGQHEKIGYTEATIFTSLIQFLSETFSLKESPWALHQNSINLVIENVQNHS